MSDQTVGELDWDAVLGGVEADEKEAPDKPRGDFEALPKGPYNVVVQDASKETSGAGNDMIKTYIRVTEGPYANRTLFSYIVFTQNPKGNRMTLEKLAAFGLTREWLAQNRPSVPAIAEALVGLKAVAVVGVQEEGDYKGRNEVKGFRPLEGGATAPAAPAASKPAGVPNIPKPAAEAAAPPVPVPQVPTGDAASADPFEG